MKKHVLYSLAVIPLFAFGVKALKNNEIAKNEQNIGRKTYHIEDRYSQISYGNAQESSHNEKVKKSLSTKHKAVYEHLSPQDKAKVNQAHQRAPHGKESDAAHQTIHKILKEDIHQSGTGAKPDHQVRFEDTHEENSPLHQSLKRREKKQGSKKASW